MSEIQKKASEMTEERMHISLEAKRIIYLIKMMELLCEKVERMEKMLENLQP